MQATSEIYKNPAFSNLTKSQRVRHDSDEDYDNVTDKETRVDQNQNSKIGRESNKFLKNSSGKLKFQEKFDTWKYYCISIGKVQLRETKIQM